MLFRSIYIAAGLLLISEIAKSQQTGSIFPRHEITINAGGGLSTLNYKSSIATPTNGFGGQAGVGYTFFFSKHWGINTGVDLGLFTAKASLNNGFSRSYAAISQGGLLPGEDFTFTYTLDNYSESQQALYLSIPLALQFQTAGHHKFYAMPGMKIAFPVSAKYKADGYTLTTQGFFPSDGRTYNDLPKYGFGEYGASTKGDLELDMAYLVTLEAGMKWALGMKNALYTGVYFDYGLNDVKKTSGQTFVTYRGSGEPPVQSLIQSGIDGQEVTGKIVPVALGIKIRFAFGLGAIKNKEKSPPVSVSGDIQKPIEEPSPVKEIDKKLIANQDTTREEATLPKIIVDSVIIETPVAQYELNEVVLTSTQKKELDEKITLMKQNPGMQVHIYGHTCDLGNDAVNDRIGLQRAVEAKTYLILQGIEPKSIRGTTSKRDTEPLVPNINEENRRKNRRVELKIIN